MRSPEVRAARFDAQAPNFDRRAGLPASARAQIADAIVAIAELGPGARILDVGAGTGEITVELLRRGFACAALDESPAMLDVLRAKATEAGRIPELLLADAASRWPVPDHGVKLVFGSRSLHWLDPEHVAAETIRVASARGGLLLVGRVERSAASPRARIRSAMRERLRAAGFEGRSGHSSSRAILAACARRGGAPIVARVAARWTTRATPRSIIDGWRRKTGLGGVDVPDSVKNDVLTSTEAWAREAYGDNDAPVESEEWYTLEGVVVPLEFDR